VTGPNHPHAEVIFQRMSRTAVKNRTPLVVELVGLRSKHAARLATCGKPNRGATGTGGQKKGLMSCKSTSCFRCQARAGKRAGTRSWSLVVAGSSGVPVREQMSAVTINAPDRNLSGFKRAVRNFMIRHGLKWTGEYSVSLAGMLHVHVLAVHPHLSGLALRSLLVTEFGAYPWINVKKLALVKKVKGEYVPVTEEDAVRGWIQYAHVPIKMKDFRNHPDLKNADWVCQFLEWDASVHGDRRCEGGFTLEEKASAARMKRAWTKKRRSGYGTTPRTEAIKEGIQERIRQSKLKHIEKLTRLAEPRDPMEGLVQLGSVRKAAADIEQEKIREWLTKAR